jgi:ABC-type antimicrobial peptide transport system permease subunit
MQERIWGPLAMATSGFGWPAREDPTAPWGHYQTPLGLLPQPPTGGYALDTELAGPHGDVLAIFSFLTVLVTAAGIYSSISMSVRQRTREIGVRLALGATSAAIMLMTLKRGALIGAGGIAIGAGLAFLLTRYLTALLVGVSPNDPATFVVMGLAFAAIAVLASWFPARRAARLHPTIALRDG